MASFFGEVTGLSSRAVDDGDSEEFVGSELIFDTTNVSNGLSCDFVVFADGKMASAFVDSYFRVADSELVATARLNRNDYQADNFSGLDYRKRPRDVAHVFINSKNPKLLICEVEERLPEELNVNFCQKVLSLCCDNVESITLMSCHSANHKTDAFNINPDSFLRCLLTSKFIEKYSALNIPYLKPPNIITDFPAAVLTEFQIQNQAAALVICYTDVPTLDSKTVGLFNDVLKIPFVQQKIPVNENATSRLKEYLKSHSKQADNLYI